MVSVPCGEITSVFQLDPLLSNTSNFSIYLWATRICQWKITGSPHFLRWGNQKFFLITKSFLKYKTLCSLYHIFTVLVFSSHLTSLCLSFLNCKMGEMKPISKTRLSKFTYVKQLGQYPAHSKCYENILLLLLLSCQPAKRPK